MRKFLLWCIFLGITISSIGQSRFGYGISVYPNFSGARLISFGNISERQIQEINDREIWKFSYAGGIFANWRSEKLGFQVGLNYMNSGYQTIRDTVPTAAPNPRNAEDWRFIYQSNYIEVPVDLQFFQELERGSEFFFMLGASFSYNLNNRVDTIFYFGDSETSEQEDQENSEYNGLNFAFQFALGWEKALGDNFALIIQPTFQFWFRGLLKDNTFNRSLYSLGLRVAFKFKQPEFR